MKKVKALATIKDNRIYSLTVIEKTGDLCYLINPNWDEPKYQYFNLQDIMTSILNILDNNGMYVDYEVSFGAIWPEIYITKLSDNIPSEIIKPEHYGYKPIKYRQAGLNKRGPKYEFDDKGRVIYG